ncbi:hypothetical protein ACJJIK_12195 [Microbulbifer sp. ZKSA006]|uniref:hypothetical protein n=1 Tax=Microbulbifer sp. ZKSA006 TaxID=3243390 RepID=UPI0040395E2E
MHTGIFRLFLLTLLLAFGGQAMASSCAEKHEAPAVSIPAEAPHCDGTTPANCNDSHASSCTVECSCCAGPSTSSAVNTPDKIPADGRNLQVTAYREFNSSPDPEMALRPPILRI